MYVLVSYISIKQVLEMMLTKTGVADGDVVLEAGSGQGINTLLLSKIGKHISYIFA